MVRGYDGCDGNLLYHTYRHDRFFDMALKIVLVVLLITGVVISPVFATTPALTRPTTAPIALENHQGMILRDFAITDAPENAVILRS